LGRGRNEADRTVLVCALPGGPRPERTQILRLSLREDRRRTRTQQCSRHQAGKDPAPHRNHVLKPLNKKQPVEIAFKADMVWLPSSQSPGADCIGDKIDSNLVGNLTPDSLGFPVAPPWL